MEDYTLEQNERTCLKKRKFTKKYSAAYVLEAEKTGKLLRSFKCKACKYFHITVDKERVAARQDKLTCKGEG